MKSKLLKSRGFGMVEVLIGATILTVGFMALMNLYLSSYNYSSQNINQIKAGLLLEEGQEAVRILRDNSWSSNIGTLSTTTTYGIYFNNSTWVATTTVSNVDNIFARTFRIYDVKRDGSQDISSSGTYDSNIKKVVFSVSWVGQGSTTTKSVSTYITNVFSN